MDISYYNSRICVLEVGDRKKKILYDRHNITISYHLGFSKTYAVVKKYNFLVRIEKICEKLCDEMFLMSKKKRVEQVKHPWLLQPLTTPNRK